MKKNLDRRCVVKRCVRGVLLLAVLTGGAGAEDEQYRWNLADIYVDKQAWRDAKTAASKSFAELEPCKGKLGQSAESLRKCLDTVFAIRKEVARVAGYASMLSDEDTRVDEHAQMRSEARLLFSAFSEETSFLRPELLAVGKSKVAGFVATESGLAIYRQGGIHLLGPATRCRTPGWLRSPGRILLAALTIPEPCRSSTIGSRRKRRVWRFCSGFGGGRASDVRNVLAARPG